jgi:GABA(A) receptor-associated protein
MFKQEHAFDKRVEVSKRIREKYTDRIPVIVERSPRSDLPNIDKKKFLVPNDLTAGRFLYEIRKHIHIDARKALFLFVGQGQGTLPPTGMVMSQIYERYKDDDGFLYFTYAGENVFG